MRNVKVKKNLKKIIHIYLPEDSGKRRPNSTEYYYFEYLFKRRLNKCTLHYYTERQKKDFLSYLKKEKNDYFGVILDLDFQASGADKNERIAEIQKLANLIKEYNNCKLYISVRSWETWMCMHRSAYTKPFSNQTALEKDVSDDYKKTQEWYNANSEELYNSLELALKNCKLARKNVVNNVPAIGKEFIDEIPDFTITHNINKLFEINTVTYVDFFIDGIRSFDS